VRRNANNCVNVLKECVKPGNGIAVAATTANPVAITVKLPKAVPVETTANPADPCMVVLVATTANPVAITVKLPKAVPVETTANPADPCMVVLVATTANPVAITVKLPEAVPVATTANPADLRMVVLVETTANLADLRMVARILNMAIPLGHRTVAPAAIMESPPMPSPTIIQGVTMDQKTVIPRVVGMTNTAVTVQDIHGVPPLGRD
jgi:hypothetical protein